MGNIGHSHLIFGISETKSIVYSVEYPLFADAYSVVSDWHFNRKKGSRIYLPYDLHFERENKGMPIYWVTRPIRTARTTLLISGKAGSSYLDSVLELKEFMLYARDRQLLMPIRYYVDYGAPAQYTIERIVEVDPAILRRVEIHYGNISRGEG